MLVLRYTCQYSFSQYIFQQNKCFKVSMPFICDGIPYVQKGCAESIVLLPQCKCNNKTMCHFSTKKKNKTVSYLIISSTLLFQGHFWLHLISSSVSCHSLSLKICQSQRRHGGESFSQLAPVSSALTDSFKLSTITVSAHV